MVAVTAAIGGDVTLCGSSSGAVLCAEAALLTRPSKLVLYEPPLPITEPIYPVGFVDHYQQLLQAGHRDHDATEFLLMVIGDAAAVSAMRSQPALWDRLVGLTDTALHEIRSLDAYRFDADRITGFPGDDADETMAARRRRAAGSRRDQRGGAAIALDLRAVPAHPGRLLAPHRWPCLRPERFAAPNPTAS